MNYFNNNHYSLEITKEPNGEPVCVNDLKIWLRLNTDFEDSILCECITTARLMFENLTRIPVLQTKYRQWFYRLEHLNLIVGNVTSVDAFNYYDQTNTLVAAENYQVDLTNLIPSLWIPNGYPQTSYTMQPVGYVDFTAGWATVDQVPSDIKIGIKLLAAYDFQNRDQQQGGLPARFMNVVNKYKTGMINEEVIHNHHHRRQWGGFYGYI